MQSLKIEVAVCCLGHVKNKTAWLIDLLTDDTLLYGAVAGDKWQQIVWSRSNR